MKNFTADLFISQKLETIPNTLIDTWNNIVQCVHTMKYYAICERMKYKNMDESQMHYDK